MSYDAASDMTRYTYLSLRLGDHTLYDGLILLQIQVVDISERHAFKIQMSAHR